ncbi:MAG: hypothetical protein KGL93_14260 [Gemmatimonadota bacterium]|nr:hypothetical protein [Gemmatimonadota bacterium]
MTDTTSRSDAVWSTIEQNKRTDRFIRRVGIAAWSATLIAVLGYAIIVGFQVSAMIKLMAVGGARGIAVGAAITPIVVVVGLLALLIAVLATIGSFVRMRTTNLAEIQLRLAALEELLTARSHEA